MTAPMRVLVLAAACSLLVVSCGEDFSEVEVISAVADSEGGVMLSVASCNSRPAPEATVVSEDATAVVVEADADDSSSDDCADGAVICLEQPLGDRDLIDGSTGKRVSVEVWQDSEDFCG